MDIHEKNGTMFGSLKNIINNDWYNNSQNYVIKMSTIKENTLWQVFSIYKTPYTNDYIFKQSFQIIMSFQNLLIA